LTTGSRATVPRRSPHVAVVGPADATREQERIAHAVGSGLASAGCVVVTGGLGGVMAAASRGAVESGGWTLGLLPGTNPDAANAWLSEVVPTGLGEGRNALVVRSAAALIAVGGGWGTLSEIALALRAGLLVVGIDSWDPVPPGPNDDGRRVLAEPDATAAVARVTEAIC
jgi:uncharacterized protein (TIGR00725 family)